MKTYDKQSPESIQQMFGSIAKRYDQTNAVLSLQMHHLWNKQLVKEALSRHNPSILLDLCAGTGEIAFRYLQKTTTPCKAYLLDFCPEMLDHARQKAEYLPLRSHAIEYLKGDAQQVPLLDQSVDCVTIAYGIRNVQDPLKCASEAFRVLRPKGIFAILELTQPENKLIKLGHAFYLKNILPAFGKLLTSNKDAYSYLCNSIHTFIPPSKLEQILTEAGFIELKRKSLACGTATIITALKD